ncbi:uncharacterized protein LOC113554059 [Rhopalosiphum maidis]|uniref:uncharacterized protein LOC113554059 n=1 Tax=Rhopalosiphum maidis TaxID=43146 RepID=UPI000EFFAA09|nr:uncharacterized protein LOC113554059 [Rhopalosiphum maidis]
MEADEPSYEFSTLKCQWSLTDSPTVTVHLKVAFCDEAVDHQARMALQVTAIVNLSSDDYVVYTGFVMGDKAADQTLNSGVQHDDDESTIVRIWLRDARAALVCSSGDKPSAEYEYHLRREDGDNDQLLTLAWKIKVRPFGLATLGTVQMREVTSTMSVTCTSFITPLIRLLSAERKQRELSDLAAADCERRLSEDNRRLLNELRSMVDSRQLDDQRLMAQFVEVLNTKKHKITDLQQKLADLKLECNVLQPMVAASDQDEVIGRRRRGRGTCRSQPRSICKIRRSTISSQNIKWCPSSSEDENVGVQLINGEIQQPSPMEVDGLNRVNISGNVVLDTEETLMSTSIPESSVPVFPIVPIPTSPENIPIDPRYLADTQIDSPSSSPTWLQQSLTVSPSPQLQPSINQHDKHELPKKKSVLDDLWSGIL